MQFFPRLEAHRPARLDGDLCAGARISAYSRFTRPHAKNAKSPQFNSVAGRESIFHAFEDGVHGCLCFYAREACTVRNFMNYVLFNQVIFSVRREGWWM